MYNNVVNYCSIFNGLAFYIINNYVCYATSTPNFSKFAANTLAVNATQILARKTNDNNAFVCFIHKINIQNDREGVVTRDLVPTKSTGKTNSFREREKKVRRKQIKLRAPFVTKEEI